MFFLKPTRSQTLHFQLYKQSLLQKIPHHREFRTAIFEQSLFIYIIKANDTDVPSMVGCITLREDLTERVSANQKPIPASHYCDIVNGSIKLISQLINLMARLKVWCETETAKPPTMFCIMPRNKFDELFVCD